MTIIDMLECAQQSMTKQEENRQWSKFAKGQIAMVCIRKRFFTIRVVKHGNGAKRLNISTLGDIQNSESTLSACSKLTRAELEVGQDDLWRSLPTYMSL